MGARFHNILPLNFSDFKKETNFSLSLEANLGLTTCIPVLFVRRPKKFVVEHVATVKICVLYKMRYVLINKIFDN